VIRTGLLFRQEFMDRYTDLELNNSRVHHQQTNGSSITSLAERQFNNVNDRKDVLIAAFHLVGRVAVDELLNKLSVIEVAIGGLEVGEQGVYLLCGECVSKRAQNQSKFALRHAPAAVFVERAESVTNMILQIDRAANLGISNDLFETLQVELSSFFNNSLQLFLVGALAEGTDGLTNQGPFQDAGSVLIESVETLRNLIVRHRHLQASLDQNSCSRKSDGLFEFGVAPG